MTRWHKRDLTGQIIKSSVQRTGSDDWEVIEFPAIMPSDKPLWPEFWPPAELQALKEELPNSKWMAQYQQQPTSESSAIVKREWWNIWEHDKLPSVEYVIMSLDAAAEKHNRADYTALTTWGVFHHEETSSHNIILLDSIKERLEFPELKELAMEQYKHWDPDAFIVEKKSSGVALYQEMRRMGLPVTEYTPHRGTGDKMARLNSVSDIISSGMVWVPATRWADELVEEVAGFPFMSNDDLVDSTVMALLRFRQGGFIRLPTDMEDDDSYLHRKAEYY
jgi:predicted phage terminase large subunit-like protein